VSDDADVDAAAKLIERLLSDPGFRDGFRRDPVLTCRQAGLEELAEEMRLGGGKAMHTLDIRESRSSLAGVMMAAAMEGMGVYEFSKHVVPHIEDLSGSLGDVLSRVNLPALPGAGARAGGREPSAARLAPPDEEVAAESAAGRGSEAAPASAAPVEDASGRAGAERAPEAASANAGKSIDAPAPPEAVAAKSAESAPAAPELAGEKPPKDEGGGELRTGTRGGAELPEGPARLEPAEDPKPAPEPAPAPAAAPPPAARRLSLRRRPRRSTPRSTGWPVAAACLSGGARPVGQPERDPRRERTRGLREGAYGPTDRGLAHEVGGEAPDRRLVDYVGSSPAHVRWLAVESLVRAGHRHRNRRRPGRQCR
jgi:hypothetical protein